MGRRFGTVPAEVPAVRDLAVLAPKFRAALERVLADLRGLGMDPLVIETLRTHDRQRFLYGFGRDYDDGRGTVTYSSDADETWHGFGLAADVISQADRWNAPLAFWEALGRSADRHGLLWGADWDGDGDFTTGDFVLAFQGGGYEKGPKPAVAAVPEPTGLLPLLFGGLLTAALRRRR